MVIDNNMSLPSCGDSALPSGNSYAIMAAEFDSRGGKNMGRDMAKKAITDYKWEKENCMRLNMKIRNDSGIPEAIARVKEAGQSANAYAIAALRKQLIADGYLSPSAETEE